MVEAFLAVHATEPRFVMELCAQDGETMLAPVGVAMVLSSAVNIDPPKGGDAILLPTAPP